MKRAAPPAPRVRGRVGSGPVPVAAALAFVVVLAPAATPPARAGGPRPFSVEDLVTLPVIDEMAWSPSGERLAWTVQRANLDADTIDTTLWIADFRHAPARITPVPVGEGGVWNLRWTPDGGALACLSMEVPAEDGSDDDAWDDPRFAPQVHRLPGGTGAPVAVTRLPGGVDRFEWDRGGGLVVLVPGSVDEGDGGGSGDAPPESDDGGAAPAPGVDDDASTPALAESDAFLQSGEVETSLLLRIAPDGRTVVHLPSPRGDVSIHDFACDRVADVVWVVTGPREFHGGEVQEAEVHRIPLDGSAPERITRNAILEDQPVPLPGGGVALLTGGGLGPRGRQRAGPTGISLAGVEGIGTDGLRPLVDGETRDFHSMDGARTMDVLPGGGALLALGTRGLDRVPVRVDLATGAVTEPGCPPMVADALAVAPAGGRVALVLSDAGRFPEIWIAPEPGRLAEARPLTDLHRSFADHALPVVERITWKAPDGLEIEGILVSPRGVPAERRSPLVLAPHGGPFVADTLSLSVVADFTAPAPLFAARGWRTLFVNYRGSTGRGGAFLRALEGVPFTGPAGDVLAGLDHLVARGSVDPARVFVTGYSYGGAVALALAVEGRPFAAVAAGAPISNDTSYHGVADNWFLTDARYGAAPWEDPQAYVRESPLFRAARCRAPVLLLHGCRDGRVPESQSMEFHRALRRCGVETDLLHFPGSDHDFPYPSDRVRYVRAVMEWFRERAGE